MATTSSPALEQISIRVIAETRGGHVHVRLFVGKDADHRAKAGDFVLRAEEWPLFERLLIAGGDRVQAAGLLLSHLNQEV